MPIKMAIFSASVDRLRQAEKEFADLSLEAKLDLETSLFWKVPKLLANLDGFDIAAIYESDFFKMMPELTAYAESKGRSLGSVDNRGPKPGSGEPICLCDFTIPVNKKDFMETVSRLPARGSTLDIPIPKGRKIENVSNIVFFENTDRRIQILTSFESYITSLTMRQAHELTAGYPFVSPYVSYLVNLAWVERIAGRDVLLRNKGRIPLSQKRAAGFKRAYRDYLSTSR